MLRTISSEMREVLDSTFEFVVDDADFPFPRAAELNKIVRKCGITRMGNLIEHGPVRIRTLVGGQGFEILCATLGQYGLGWDTNIEGWEAPHRFN
jgi:hypothetical protein